MSNKPDQKGKFFRWSFFILFFLFVFIRGTAAQNVAVVSPDSPLPCIVTTENKIDQDAALDLCNYLSRVSGQKIIVSETPADNGVIIHIGRDAFVREHAPEIESLFADGYIVKALTVAGRNHIILAGKIDPSSQWAVEQFLKDYGGVHWLFPDPVYGEIVPSRPTITIDSALSKTYQPDYLSRGNLSMYYFNPARTQLRLRSNAYQYGSHAIQFIFNNGSSSGEVFAQHPEWFAFFNGKRQWWAYGNGWQICTTNPETVQHAVKYVLDYFAKNPDSPMVSVGPNDGWGECECPECTKFLNSADPPYTVSERWFHWVNQVAKEVAKTYPDKWVESLAYSQTSTPTRFPLEPNVAITKTIVLANELQQAEEWGKVCKSVNLYSYMFGFHMLGFRHYPHAVKDFLKWGHDKLGALAHAPECAGNWTFDGPKYHYIQALQWDVNTDVDALMDEFCALSYGLAAKPMRAFWDRHETVYENREPTPDYGSPGTRFLFYQWPGWSSSSYLMPNNEFNCYRLADAEFLDQCITEATRLAAKDSKEVQFRVARIADAWDLVRTMLLSKLKYYDQPGLPVVTSGETMRQALDRARELADLRVDRINCLGKLRTYSHINPYACLPYYWSMASAYTIFSQEQTWLDDLCSAISEYLTRSGGLDAARKFWEAQIKIAPDDNLGQFAQTQLYLLHNPSRPNRILNGNFETGNLSGWEVSGSVSASSGTGRNATFAARMTTGTLSQSVPVSPLERYRLTAWVRYTAKPKGYMVNQVPAEVTPKFFSGSRELNWFEPMRFILRTADPVAGWTKISITMTAPPETDRVVINLENQPSFAGAVLWDEVSLEKIKPGPAVQNGYLRDDFSGRYPDANQWTRSPVSSGFQAPEVRAGWLTFSQDSYDLISLASFNDLIAYTGPDRYRLKIHAAPMHDDNTPAGFTWGLQNGAGLINTNGTGPYSWYDFASSQNPTPRFSSNVYNNSSYSGSALYKLNHLNGKNKEVWLTIYFDPEFITVYASADGYDDTEASFVGAFRHGITNLTANGNIYFKLESNRSIRLNEISLTSPRNEGKPETAKPIEHDQIWDAPRL